MLPALLLSLITAACLTPFVGKAVHMDDPLFLWAARHIQSNPLDFYGFSVNWYGKTMPMFQVTKNPPLTSYYIAAVAHFFGWKEATLHAAFILPAIAAVTGTYFVSKELCMRPFHAAIAGMITPVFFLSGTSLMCDVMMLSIWVWAMFFWIRGIKAGSVVSLLASVFLVALCSLTKYYGMSLIPLLSAYAFAKRRRPGLWSLLLLIPVGILVGYQLLTYNLYGKGLLSAASSYAVGHEDLKGAHFFLKTLTGLSFTGGCFITALFYSFHLWRRRTLAAGAIATAFFVLVVLSVVSQIHTTGWFHLYEGGAFNWTLVIQCYLFSLAGVIVLCLATSDLRRTKDAEGLLLFLWIIGTFVFASYLNWSINGRSVLPMGPAIGILIFRRIGQAAKTAAAAPERHILAPLVPALFVALMVVSADYRLADASRSEASTLGRSYAGIKANIWFKGHWGFQYYMEKEGGNPLDAGRSIIARGDLLIVPTNNTNSPSLPPGVFNLVAVFRVAPGRWLTTMSRSLGAGFYSDLWGPLPYAVGAVPDEEYYVFMATEGSMSGELQLRSDSDEKKLT